MESENEICLQCQNFKLRLVERESEVTKLKMHVQNLTNYLLSKDNSPSNISDVYMKVDLDELNKPTVYEEKFYSSDLFIKCCDILNECIIQESKSTQTDNTEYPDNFNSACENEISKSEDRNLRDYVYDKNYQMYYNYSTGYYYDEKSGLMYEPQSGMYYRYNYEKEEYENVSQENSSNLETEENKTSTEANESYNCETVVDQVSNLNLNDDSSKLEKSSIEINDVNILEYERSSEFDNEKCSKIDMKLPEDNVSLGCAQEWQPTEGSKLTVADIVKKVVDEHTNMSDYVYDETYQMYYSPSTGYFFDSVRNLLYDPTSGNYYFYDADKQTYEFYCQVEYNAVDKKESESGQNGINKERLACRKLYWKKKLECSKKTTEITECDVNCNKKDPEDIEEFSSPEDGEIFSSDEDDSSVPVCIVKSPIREYSINNQKCAEESYPPSIRAIVENSEKLQIGSLILITCSGGIIGRDKTSSVYIPDICISKLHAEIKYNSDLQSYSIGDLGSQNGTFINEKRLSEPKIKSEEFTLSHGDRLALGSCKLLIHIHDGHDTCDNCEPGQVLAEISSNIEKTTSFISKEEKEKMRRQELRRLKQKYGLERSDFEVKSMPLTCSGYEDKSQIRRETVGSDNPYEKTQEASIDVSMPATNKGYQMLKKMGWKEGQTLGISETGLAEPIPLRPWTSKAGLGSACNPSCSSENLEENNRAQKWVKARERYFQLSLGTDPS